MYGKSPFFIACGVGLANAAYWLWPVLKEDADERGRRDRGVLLPPSFVSLSAHPYDSAKRLRDPISKELLLEYQEKVHKRKSVFKQPSPSPALTESSLTESLSVSASPDLEPTVTTPQIVSTSTPTTTEQVLQTQPDEQQAQGEHSPKDGTDTAKKQKADAEWIQAEPFVDRNADVGKSAAGGIGGEGTGQGWFDKVKFW